MKTAKRDRTKTDTAGIRSQILRTSKHRAATAQSVNRETTNQARPAPRNPANLRQPSSVPEFWITCSIPFYCGHREGLEHPAEREEPLSMACVSDASPDEQRTKERLCNHPGRPVSGKSAHVRRVKHFTDLKKCDGVNALADERRQSERIVQLSSAEEIVLISSQLVLAVCKPPGCRSKKVLWNAGCVDAQSGPGLSEHEHRGRPGDGFEEIGFQLQTRRRGGRSRACVHPVKIQLSQITAARNDPIVRMVRGEVDTRSCDSSADR